VLPPGVFVDVSLPNVLGGARGRRDGVAVVVATRSPEVEFLQFASLVARAMGGSSDPRRGNRTGLADETILATRFKALAVVTESALVLFFLLNSLEVA